MTLRLRLCVAAGLLLVVLGVAGYVLIGTVEASQLQQIDQELQTALPRRRSWRPWYFPRASATFGDSQHTQ